MSAVVTGRRYARRASVLMICVAQGFSPDGEDQETLHYEF